MFVEFFYYLKERLPVSVHEFLALSEALHKGLIHNMVEFYYTTRSLFAKNEFHFDIFDIAFANFFQDAGLKFPAEIRDEIYDWLNTDIEPFSLPFPIEELSRYIDLEDLEKQLRQLLDEQKEAHNFGNKYIGTQGTSPFGTGGFNEFGIQIAGDGGMHQAVRIAQKRIFKDYRKDIVLDTRQIKVALKRLRKLDEIGKKNELDIDKTIDETCKNGGDLDLVMRRKRKNNVKILLLMDVGGTMDPYAHMVNLLFSAANQVSHWKAFKPFYFHNCVYDKVYFDAARNDDNCIDFEDFLVKYDESYRCILVGDQTMARSELKSPYGGIHDGGTNKKPGFYYLERLAHHFKRNIIWLNPETFEFEWFAWTRLVISKVIPTFPLTIEGIEQSMDYLRNNGKNIFTTVDLLKGVQLAIF